MIATALLLFASTALAAPITVEVTQACALRADTSADSESLNTLGPGRSYKVLDLQDSGDDQWVMVRAGDVAGWLGPDCGIRSTTGTATAPPPDAKADASDDAPPSYGGIFLGRAGTNDEFLGQGGQLSVGATVFLRIKDTPWFAGMSAAYVGGSRFERQVIPYVPVLGSTGGLGVAEGIGNVASIYTDVKHMPLTAITGYGWRVWRMEFIVGGGPSAHRIEVRRREQVSGVQKSKQSGGDDGDRAFELELTTYTIDRLYDGRSTRWAAGVAGHAAALFDAGKMPIVKGRWSIGFLTSAMTPIGRQGCKDLEASGGERQPFGTICVPLQYEEVRRLYYNQGKENTDSSRGNEADLVVGVSGFTWSVNSVLFFQF